MQIGDKIVFKFYGETMEYQVTGDPSKSVFLSLCGEYPNDKIFKILGINDRYSFCEGVIRKSLQNKSATFPELDSLEDLEKVVDALYKRIIELSTPKFRVGDFVRIVKIDGNGGDYPCYYTYDMTKYENQISIIKEVHELSTLYIKRNIHRLKYEEPFYYVLAGNGWDWSSAMLHKVDIIPDIGTTNLKEIPSYHATAITCDKITCDKAVDGPSLYPEKSEDSEYKLNFSIKPLKFLKDV